MISRKLLSWLGDTLRPSRIGKTAARLGETQKNIQRATTMSSQASGNSPFPWTDSYLLGYPPMDDTHREFVDIVDEMLKSDKQAAALMQRFSEHAERHFTQEREWMESTEFPAAGCHADEHDKVMASVKGVLEQIAKGDISNALPLAHALKDWFPGHADYMDASLGQWMAKRRMGGVPVVLRRNILARDDAAGDRA